jgi:Chaperone of endosialidase
LNNTVGVDNTANGAFALLNNISSQNTAVGIDALHANTGSSNTGIGAGAFANKTTGDGNIALGNSAAGAGPIGNNNIFIGHPGFIGSAFFDRIFIGYTQNQTYIAGIYGGKTTDGIPVVVDANDQLGTLTSSARFKEDIKPMDKVSESLFAFKPVTFRYKKEIDAKRIPQFGLVAEEVAKVNPDLVVTGRDGTPYTVRYDAVNAMLLNEFLKEHGTVQELKTTVAQQQKQIEMLTAGLQKVSTQLALSKFAPQTAVNNH